MKRYDGCLGGGCKLEKNSKHRIKVLAIYITSYGDVKGVSYNKENRQG
jgi:hypothetical protein